MAGIGVSEGRNNFIFSLKSALNQLGLSKEGIRIAKNGEAFDAVLVGNPPPKKDIHFDSRFLIIPDCLDGEKLSPIPENNIISYGLRSKNTVTASSLIGEKLVVALQKEIPTINGNTVDEQEFSVNVKNGGQSDKVLGVVSTLLALDVPVEAISKIDFNF
ncbi:MAG: hypothetical protein E7473_06765 [Ruminococcaceae bacterium]|nr:hypothetical protein [Oscillospiraceae bacterium]MBQ7119611.1 hypothetical protein [Oscillospiraceae bacterium]